MTLDQLRCLVALDEHRNFTRAAEAVYLSQPALSLQIAKLERELGVVLFDRKSRPLKPTEVGEAVIAHARRVLALVEEMKALVQGEGYQGPFRLGVIPTVGPYLLPRLLPAFSHLFPGVRLEAVELLTPEILKELQEGRLDAGLIASWEEEQGLSLVPLFQEPFYLYISPQHPLYAKEAIAPLEVRASEAWVLAEGHCFREQVLSVCQPELMDTRPYAFQGGHLDTLVRLVDGVGGLTFLPQMAAQALPEEAKRHLRPFLPPTPSRTVYLVEREGSAKRFLSSRLAQLLKAWTLGSPGSP